ncbi:HxlR family transcriptional regulator [Alloalcanivorax dieselolei B5]|uniref:HxlR family transcriptional regulator n=1 Tax=Alcanivorax dieselolei (strain DSM 16502 / CGMCC 1.3690 / MCCC 1A00001 / B-5) TaxID=930169 RepID=K0CE77_ALCDB|nr:helix-turn-helix domain-containing protein [Alloalcanivorax dieselolei]AFT71914.1 HxlR family transcriptional regulator [Alloalcanivorax dieselolei B5]GGK08853.1 transcriptional regulator [Alloalcanivorax dieselolei]
MARKTVSQPVRGSTTGRPIMVLLDLLGQRWVLRILWELRGEPLSFRELQARCGQLSPTVLNERIKKLRERDIVEHQEGAGYRLTKAGRELGEQLLGLYHWSERWWG